MAPASAHACCLSGSGTWGAGGWPILEAAAACDVPLYLHPNTPSKQLIPAFLDRGLDGAIYGFGVETGLHLLRIITAGLFDRFPNLRICVGRENTLKLEKKPSDYLREKCYVTTSGMPWTDAILYCQNVLGMDRVLYAMDYPYQFVADEVREQDNLSISLEDKRRFFQTNAETVFKL